MYFVFVSRLWKTFNVWRMNVRNRKNTVSQQVLHKILFTANEVLQGCLLHVRDICEAASSSITGRFCMSGSFLYVFFLYWVSYSES